MTLKRIIGIQGGQGSYNEIAVLKHLESLSDVEADIRYLFSTQNVFDALQNEQIDWGQFAVSNSVGGYVGESLEAIAAFLSAGNGINVIANYDCKVIHRLMAHPLAKLEQIERVMSHPQVFKQCKNNLQANYAYLELVEGDGEYSDPARIADGIASGEISPNTATLSNPKIAEIYGLKLISDELQDFNRNMTRFLLVEKAKNQL